MENGKELDLEAIVHASESGQELKSPVIFHSKTDENWKNAVEFNPSKKSSKYRQYLILAYMMEDADIDIDKTFSIEEGRVAAYNYIKSIIEYIDVNKSIIILEGNKALQEHITVLQFLRHIKDEELIEDDDRIIDEIIAENNLVEDIENNGGE